MLDVRPTRVYMRSYVGAGSGKYFATTRVYSPLKKDVTDKPIFDRIICLLDQFVLILDRIMCNQFISKETDQHWFILRKTSQKNAKLYPIMLTFFTN